MASGIARTAKMSSTNTARPPRTFSRLGCPSCLDICARDAAATVDAARTEYDRRKTALDELNNKVQAHIEFVQDNDLRNINVNELIAAAVKAVSDGYGDGIASNQGITRKAGGAQ